MKAEEREILKENLKKQIDELSDEELDKVAGGRDISYSDSLRQCQRLTYVKYACPKCGSRNVRNYDPGWMWQMRVACLDCGFWGCRDGEANSITDEERQQLMSEKSGEQRNILNIN